MEIVNQDLVKRRPGHPNKVPLAFACPHVDKPNQSLGLCAYCYFQARRGYPEKKKNKLLALHDIRQTLKAVGVPWYGSEYARAMRYGLLPKELDALFEKQEGRCAACRTLFGDAKFSAPNVDHRHACCPKLPTCGKCTRGLLCGRCNMVLGMLKEDPNLLPNYLAEYVSRYPQS